MYYTSFYIADDGRAVPIHPHPELVALGKAIAALREEKHISRGTLGERAKLEPDYIKTVEEGEHKAIMFVTVRKIAKALGVTVAQLMVRAGL